MAIPINYVEFKAKNLETIKTFYAAAFGWRFIDYGPTYIAFENSGIEGGFEQSDEEIKNGALIVLHSKNLPQLVSKIEALGGKITRPTFSFPGGQRFHFQDPAGNELAIWSE